MKGIGKVRRLLNNMEYFLDEYEHYNFDPVATTLSHSRKGRSKKEASLNTNRPIPSGHERKVLTKLQNAEKRRRNVISGWLESDQGLLIFIATKEGIEWKLKMQSIQNRSQESYKNLGYSWIRSLITKWFMSVVFTCRLIKISKSWDMPSPLRK